MSNGKILLVGFGPGAGEHMTFRAREAIAEADVVIGYSTYIKLVRDLLDGKEVIRKGMTEETDRAVQAYEHAKKGKVVALISSGDIGVYGMAGPSYEILFQAGWKPGDAIEVEVVPGTTALSACASRVGSPLTHDFCSISLSDLLTPWPTIARRLDAVASSDFVIALYNPKSGRRRQQIVEAQRIFLKYRSPNTPVAIVKSAYRDLEKIQMVTLENMADCDIGMLTTVLIGNSSTFIKEGLMVTPRGYANKYEGITGGLKEGEKKGRSLSLGLDGWKAAIKEILRDSNGEQIEQMADGYGLSVEEIFLALTAPAEESQEVVDWAIQGDGDAGIATLQALDAAQSLTCLIGAAKAGQTQVALQASDFEITAEQILLQKASMTMTLARKVITKSWLIKRDGELKSVWLLNQQGDVVISLSL
ncbi:MAG TPA: precorrin-3B C(17)-methyltransferase [Thiothrix sp.]|nr:precorrin-3B C(17)-methyltransferase [Thiothrix sp.]